MAADEIEAFREYLIEDEKSDNTIDNYIYAADIFLQKYGEVNKKNMIEIQLEQMYNCVGTIQI